MPKARLPIPLVTPSPTHARRLPCKATAARQDTRAQRAQTWRRDLYLPCRVVSTCRVLCACVCSCGTGGRDASPFGFWGGGRVQCLCLALCTCVSVLGLCRVVSCRVASCQTRRRRLRLISNGFLPSCHSQSQSQATRSNAPRQGYWLTLLSTTSTGRAARLLRLVFVSLCHAGLPGVIPGLGCLPLFILAEPHFRCPVAAWRWWL
jgi:hypothetical protein